MKKKKNNKKKNQWSKNNSTKLEKKEIGGPSGPEPTRYGDWEVKGRVSDF